MLGLESIRAIARLFHTEPRRIRRALARLGLRVGGRDVVEDAGVPQLAGLRDMLGREPDRVVARMAGVIPEAVQGERGRLRIPAHVQRRRVRLSREDEAWCRGPKRGHRAKVHVEENLQVIRRPTRTDENAHRPSGWGVGHADPKPRPAVDFVARPPPRVDREFFRSPAPVDLERLLLPVRQRDGRQRIVRGEPTRGVDAPEPARGSVPPHVARAPVVRPEPQPAVADRPSARPRLASAEPLRPPLPALTQAPANPAPSEPRPVFPRPVSPRALSRRPVASPSAAPLPAPLAPAAPTPTNDEWLVYVPGNDTPLRVFAPDIVQAIGAASRIVPAELLRLASVWRADEV